MKRLSAALAEEERKEVLERMPWWKPERALKPTRERTYVDPLGRSTGLERESFDATEFVELACSGLGIVLESLAGKLKDRRTTMLRQVVATLGIERWDQRAGKLGGVLGKHPDVVSRWARAGAERRSTDQEFAKLLDQLDATLSEYCRRGRKIV